MTNKPNGEVKAKPGQGKDPRPMQKALVHELLSGNHKTKKSAVLAAGYSESSSNQPKIIIQNEGVQKYLKQLDDESKNANGKTLRKKVVDVFYAGLEATKLVGKDAVEHADHKERRKFAQEFAKWFGWSFEHPPVPHQYSQYNFFATPKDKQEEFNADLKAFIRSRKSETG
jgi:hypothetical protein